MTKPTWKAPPTHAPSPLTRLAWWWLRRRGWAWRVNEPKFCTDVYENDKGELLDRGWRPLFGIRYGKVAVYRTDDRLQPATKGRAS